MPRYSVSFTIHEALFPSLRNNNPIDPLVVVRCFGNEFVTSVKSAKTVVACWDEGYHWNNLEISTYVWNSGVIDFELQSANALWRNDTLGTTALQLKLISTCKNNTFSGKIPLTSPNSVRVIGYLSVTVNAYDLSHAGLNNDQAAITKEYEVKQPINLEVPALTSPLVYRSAILNEVVNSYKYFHLYVNVYSLEDIETELFGSNPYITCEYAGCRLQTANPIRVKGTSTNAPEEDEGYASVSEKISNYLYNINSSSYNRRTKRSNFTFNQCFLIPISVMVGVPTLEDNIIIRVWMGLSLDLPLIGNGKNSGLATSSSISARLLAEGVFSLAELRSKKQRARWYNFYRNPEKSHTDASVSSFNDNNNKYVKSDGEYIGRILLSTSIKRINKVSDVLKAHVVASHKLEPVSPSPTRIFSDVFLIESSSNFEFTNAFEVCFEISCGPFATSTDWHRVTWRKIVDGEHRSNMDFLSKGDGEGRNNSDLLRPGWFCSFDSVKGRPAPLDLLIAYSSEEQWYLFVKILGRSDPKNVKLLGSARYTLDDISVHLVNSPKVPFWISLPCKDGGSYIPPLLNVLLTLEKHMFYSSTINSSTNKDYRLTSQPRRLSMISENYELRCYIYSLMLPMPIEKDIVVSVLCEGRMALTSPRSQYTRFPVFMECLSMPVSISTSPISMIATPIPIMITVLSSFRNKRKCLYSGVTNYNRLITSTVHKPIAGKPKWLRLCNGAYILLYVDLVLKSEVHRVPKYQMLPLVKDVNIKLGILGLRDIPRDDRNELSIKASVQSYGVCSGKEQRYDFNCRSNAGWISDNLYNHDTFTVQTFDFKVPIEEIFNPHLELHCYLNEKKLIGHCSFPIYNTECNPLPFKYEVDLRFYLNPKKMSDVLELLHRQKNKAGYDFCDLKLSNTSSAHKVGLPEVLEKFEETVEFKRMNLSLSLENVSVYVPPKFVFAIDGKKIVNSSSVEYTLVTDRQLDSILNDVPYSIIELCRTGDETSIDESAHLSLPAPKLKYFLTIDDVYHSYDLALKDIATDSGKMFSAFRKGIKSSLYKLRFCVVSASNFLLDTNSVAYLAVEIAGKESRESLNCQKEKLTSDIFRVYEHDVFLPENSLVNIKAISSEESLTGETVESTIATATIDLENRWFSKQWQQMVRKDSVPIEKIFLRKNGNIQGYINAIIQMTKLEKASLLKPLTFDIVPSCSIEIRLIIWSVRGVRLPSESNKEGGMLDLYVASTLDCQSYNGQHPAVQKTDIHYNCNDGSGAFNWRVVYPEIKTPLGACHLQLALYDFWKLGAPTFIGEANLELKTYVNIVSSTNNKIQIDGEIPLFNTSKSTPLGFLHVTLQTLTQTEATAKPVSQLERAPCITMPHLDLPVLSSLEGLAMKIFPDEAIWPIKALYPNLFLL